MGDFGEERGADDVRLEEPDETDDDGEGDRSMRAGDARDSSSEDDTSTFSEDLYSRRNILHFILQRPLHSRMQNFQTSQFPK